MNLSNGDLKLSICTIKCRTLYIRWSTERKEVDVAFKVFEKGSAPIQTVPSITIQKRGLSPSIARHTI